MCDDFDPLGDLKNLVKKGYDGLTDGVKIAWDQTIAEVNRTGKKVLEETFRILGITSQTIYLVEMVSFPIITDPPKNVVQRAIITAVLENRDLMDDLLFESAYGISNSIQRLYDRADTEYVYDLPSVSLALNEVPNDEVLVYLNAQEGEPIAIINIEISPVDYGLWLQYRLIQFWGFNYNTSKLPTGETLLGWHVEGSDIVPEWDIEPANALYTSIPTYPDQYIHVVYEKVATPGIFYLFVYPRGGGWIVALDGVPDSGTDTFQMLPIIALRQDFTNIDVDKETILYKQTKSLLKEIGFPLDKLMEGINSQDETQLAFLEDVADLNNHIAENIMALYYRNKHSHNKEELQSYKEKAFIYWEKSADHLTSCAYNLAECYAKGEGTERDIEKAKIHYKKAKDQGHNLSSLRLQDLEKD